MTQGVETQPLANDLPPPVRLAVAYAPAKARPVWIALLAFDQRLARAVAGASEPLIGQLKLAWWRDRMREPAASWPVGEPLLAALAVFDGERRALETLVDGWEVLVGEDAGQGDRARLATARAGAVAALARLLDCPTNPAAVAAYARRWTEPGAPPALARLPRVLRPLAILANRPEPGRSGPLALLRIVRLGMFGR